MVYKNINARRLRLGLQINSLDSGYKQDVYEAVEKECIQKEADLLVFLGRNDFVYSHINSKNADCLIALSHNYLEYHRAKRTNKLPLITIQQEEKDVPYISINFKEKYIKLLKHLILDHKCRTFNIIMNGRSSLEYQNMLLICLDTLAEHGIQVEQKRIFSGNARESSGFEAMVYFEKEGLLPVDCVICMNDDMAVGVNYFAKTRNISIPEDLKIVAFDDILESKYTEASITTITRNISHICKTAVDMALSAAKGLALPLATTMDCKIKYRKSCGCVAPEDYETDYIDENSNRVPYNSYEVHNLDSKYFSLTHDILLMKTFIGNINQASNLKTTLENIEDSFHLLKLKACAIVLFERKLTLPKDTPFELPSRAQLMLNYRADDFNAKSKEKDERKQITSVLFDPRETILPPDTFTDERHTLIFNPLIYDENILGYMIYEPGKMHKILYDSAFTMVASMLNAAIFFTERIATEQHQSLMLKELEHSNSKLNTMSLTDELTKLYNRRGFINFGQQTIELAQEMDQRGLVFYADMDGLKGINDTYGHEAGDIAIKAMAQILKKTFRNQDVLGRMGGDEFAIVAVGITCDFLPRIRERIKCAEEKWFESANQPFHLGISFGAVEFGPAVEETDLEKMMDAADKLLYEEKVKKHSRSAIKEKPMNVD